MIISPSFFDILCWTGHEGKFLSDEVYEIRASGLGDLILFPERGDMLHCFAPCT